MKIRKGKVYARDLARQSYVYRLCYVWLNFLMSEDGRCTSINPFKWSIIDILWVLWITVWATIFTVLMVFYAPYDAFTLGKVKPILFSGDKQRSTDWYYSDTWYYDNGDIVGKGDV